MARRPCALISSTNCVVSLMSSSHPKHFPHCFSKPSGQRTTGCLLTLHRNERKKNVKPTKQFLILSDTSLIHSHSHSMCKQLNFRGLTLSLDIHLRRTDLQSSTAFTRSQCPPPAMCAQKNAAQETAGLETKEERAQENMRGASTGSARGCQGVRGVAETRTRRSGGGKREKRGRGTIL